MPLRTKYLEIDSYSHREYLSAWSAELIITYEVGSVVQLWLQWPRTKIHCYLGWMWATDCQPPNCSNEQFILVLAIEVKTWGAERQVPLKVAPSLSQTQKLRKKNMHFSFVLCRCRKVVSTSGCLWGALQGCIWLCALPQQEAMQWRRSWMWFLSSCLLGHQGKCCHW